jgi:hypothetical protein
VEGYAADASSGGVLYLAEVDARTDLEAHVPHGGGDFERGSERTTRRVEDREHAVAGRADLATAVPAECRASDGEIAIDQPPEPPISEFLRHLRRPDDVKNQAAARRLP